MIIKAGIPRVFEGYKLTPRFNGNTSQVPDNCKCNDNTLMCNCSNLTTNNSGIYAIHVSFTIDLGNDNTNSPEWCSNNVTVMAQGET